MVTFSSQYKFRLQNIRATIRDEYINLLDGFHVTKYCHSSPTPTTHQYYCARTAVSVIVDRSRRAQSISSSKALIKRLINFSNFN